MLTACCKNSGSQSSGILSYMAAYCMCRCQLALLKLLPENWDSGNLEQENADILAIPIVVIHSCASDLRVLLLLAFMDPDRLTC